MSMKSRITSQNNANNEKPIAKTMRKIITARTGHVTAKPLNTSIKMTTAAHAMVMTRSGILLSEAAIQFSRWPGAMMAAPILAKNLFTFINSESAAKYLCLCRLPALLPLVC